MTIEELQGQTNAAIVKLLERIESLGLRVDNLKQNHGEMLVMLDGRLDVMDQVNISFNDKLAVTQKNFNDQNRRIEAREDEALTVKNLLDHHVGSLGDRTNRLENDFAEVGRQHTRVDALSNMSNEATDKIAAMAENVQNAVQATKCFDEMKGGVAACKAAIKNLDALRDAVNAGFKRIETIEMLNNECPSEGPCPKCGSAMTSQTTVPPPSEPKDYRCSACKHEWQA